jgi:hypothetical protein
VSEDYDDHPGTPMHDQGAELAILGACLETKHSRIEARKNLVSGDFWVPAHEVVYDTMNALDRGGRSVDLTTVRAAIHAQFPDTDPRSTDVRQRVAAEQTLASAYQAGSPTGIIDYCTIVHTWALRRRLADAGRGLTQRAMSPAEQPHRLAAQAVTMLTGIRDAGAGDVSAITLRELLDGEDEAPTWVIPNLMEAGDRLLLTGTEGAGKSALSRQMAVMAAAGMHPFTEAVMPPIRTLIFDVENKEAQVRRQIRPLVNWLRDRGADNPLDRVLLDCGPRRLNLAGDRDLAKLHQTIDAWQPQLIIMGPMYRLYPKSLNSDDDAHPFLAALDTLIDRGCALVIETHAGHTTEQQGRNSTRNLRPRGSAALLGWPEFGLGLRAIGGGLADLEPWRGHREARPWPARMRRAPGNRWTETDPNERPREPRPEEPLPDGSYAPHEAGSQGTLV